MLPEFKEPWHPTNSSDDGLKDQLHKELSKRHVLFGKKVRPIARRQDCDDVLFDVTNSDHKYAIVHLTWSMKEVSDPHFPRTQLIRDELELRQIIEGQIAEWQTRENEPLNETGGFVPGKKRIIIIGASSGIGKEMASIFALEGNLVAITGRRNELLEELRRSFDGRIITSCFDITKDNNTEHLESLVKRMGGLDLLVDSAGTGETSEDLTWEIDKRTIETNVNGFVEIANWAFNFFIQQGHGQLATISSIAAIRGNSRAPSYSASKAFQSNYFEGLSIKARRMKKDISVTCIEPGFIKTKMAQSDRLFWVVPVDKAARQIIRGIEKKRRKVYISRRWWLIAKVMKWIPYWLYRKLG
jgi:short-subunit dehydrogenase